MLPTMNCATDLINMTLSCSISVSVGMSAFGSYLQVMHIHCRWRTTATQVSVNWATKSLAHVKVIINQDMLLYLCSDSNRAMH